MYYAQHAVAGLIVSEGIPVFLEDCAGRTGEELVFNAVLLDQLEKNRLSRLAVAL